MRTHIIDELTQRLGGSGQTVVAGLGDAPAAFFIALASRGQNRPLFIVVPDQKRAETMAADLRFFLSTTAGREPTPRILPYPAPDVDPYDPLPPHFLLGATRVGTLHHLRAGTKPLIVVAPAQALLRRVLSPDTLAAHTAHLVPDQVLDRDDLVSRLVQWGYFSTDTVEDPGCFSVRGGILDIYSPAHDRPVRVELFGDIVDSIRLFDPETQRSSTAIDQYTVVPAREEILSPPAVERVKTQLKAACDQVGCPAHVRKQIVEDLESGIFFPGIEYLTSLLHPALVPVADYLEAVPVVLIDPESIHLALERYRRVIEDRYLDVVRSERFCAPPDTLFAPVDETFATLRERAALSFSHHLDTLFPGTRRMDVAAHATAWLRERITTVAADRHPLLPLVERLRSWLDDGYTIWLVAQSTIQSRRLAGLLEPYDLPARVPDEGHGDAPGRMPVAGAATGIHFLTGHLSEGFVVPDMALAVVTDHDIFGRRAHRSPDRTRLKRAVSDFSQLERGDLVVHAVHGLGVFRGLKKLEVDSTTTDFVLVEYRGGDKLYLPVHKLAVLQRYSGGGQTPPLDKLGGATFARKKRKAHRAVLKLARELLDLEAARATSPGLAFQRYDRELEAFSATFPYQETGDQAAAIDAVVEDLCSPRPMDRLICGDVGYGKTEVAIRAAYLAVLNGKQVAILAPTTVLALQHYRNFLERFREIPVVIEMLSRFTPAKSRQEILARLEQGAIDIVVGTHRLLSRDVAYRNLGLLVIDEEQRFGVVHKERIKKARTNVHVLTLSATPIPRTLYMVLGGLRSFSLVATPPPGRLAVRTHHIAYSPERIQHAVRAELKRGGQVYYVHNRVQTIHELADKLQELVPEASIAVAHGQMREIELERVMTDFVRGRYDILCSTSIIENGLDIPMVNTIIVDGAEHLGLSQLYQLRGRVGRSSRRAYAYLVTHRRLTGAARKRIQALIQHSELGSGFKIARKDLELRGAGDLLGPSQSGPMGEVGIEMYTELLEQAIRELRGGAPAMDLEPELELRISAYFPDDYIPDLHERLQYYKLLSQSNHETEVHAVLDEIEDRYGPAPPPVHALGNLVVINTLLKAHRVASLTYSRGKLVFRFHPTTPIPPERLADFVLHDPERRRLTPDGRLLLSIPEDDPVGRAETAKKVLRLLG